MSHEGIIRIDGDRGKELGFTSDRFTKDSYLWEQPTRILISLITSRAKGNFRALVAAIHAQGKDVAVPTPLTEMSRIVRKNGYCHSLEYDEAMGESVSVWTLKAPR